MPWCASGIRALKQDQSYMHDSGPNLACYDIFTTTSLWEFDIYIIVYEQKVIILRCCKRVRWFAMISYDLQGFIYEINLYTDMD